MTRRTIALVAVAAAASWGCRSPEPQPVTPTTPAERLEAILASEITLRQDSQYVAFYEEQGHAELMLLLPPLALDSTAPPLARANAVLRMGQLPMPDWDTYARTIEDRDPRVRGATLGVVGALALRDPQRSIPILARGLVDPEIAIQAKALQELRDRDLDLLRFYIESGPAPELRAIALQTLRSAQSWGAPLAPEDDGSMRRTTPAGVEIVFRPDRTWPDWELALGSVTVTPAGGSPRLLGDSIEVMSTIIPVVGDATGRYVAVERNRRITIHDLERNATSDVGPGIAPRPMPFSEDFFFFREVRRRDAPDAVQITYELVRTPFGGGEPVPFDSVVLTLRPDQRGYMSPARWARVIDIGRRFVIDTDGLRNHPLPTPVDILPSEERS